MNQVWIIQHERDSVAVLGDRFGVRSILIREYAAQYVKTQGKDLVAFDRDSSIIAVAKPTDIRGYRPQPVEPTDPMRSITQALRCSLSLPWRALRAVFMKINQNRLS